MIVFRLTMPHAASWNGKWSGVSQEHAIIKQDTPELRKLDGKSFLFTWSDGWCASISVQRMLSTDPEYKRIKKQNVGFCGYSWMVDSIIKHGEIRKP